MTEAQIKEQLEKLINWKQRRSPLSEEEIPVLPEETRKALSLVIERYYTPKPPAPKPVPEEAEEPAEGGRELLWSSDWTSGDAQTKEEPQPAAADRDALSEEAASAPIEVTGDQDLTGGRVPDYVESLLQ